MHAILLPIFGEMAPEIALEFPEFATNIFSEPLRLVGYSFRLTFTSFSAVKICKRFAAVDVHLNILIAACSLREIVSFLAMSFAVKAPAVIAFLRAFRVPFHRIVSTDI